LSVCALGVPTKGSHSVTNFRSSPRRGLPSLFTVAEEAPSPSPPRLQPRSNAAVPFYEFASPTSVLRYVDEVVASALPVFNFLYGGSASWATLSRLLR
jgi:hypothetical protein